MSPRWGVARALVDQMFEDYEPHNPSTRNSALCSRANPARRDGGAELVSRSF
jgi:hypothetical protein